MQEITAMVEIAKKVLGDGSDHSSLKEVTISHTGASVTLRKSKIGIRLDIK